MPHSSSLSHVPSTRPDLELDRMEQDLNFVLTLHRGPMIIVRGTVEAGHLASVDHNCFQKNSYDITQVAQYLTQLVEQLLLCLVQGWETLEITGDDYHVLKDHDIRYYHDNAFWLVFYILSVAN